MAYEMTPGRDPVEAHGDVKFWLTVDGSVHEFHISHEALADHFGDSDGQARNPLEAFERGRDVICRAAVDKVPSAAALERGIIIALKTADF